MGGRLGVLVGRDRELSGCDDALHVALSGRSVTLLVEGEAGIGKTRLVEELVDTATRRGAAVRRGSAHPFERTRPFGAMRDALDVHRRSTDPRGCAIAALLAGERGEGAQSGPVPDVRHRVVEEMLDLVDAACAQSPMVIVLEDLHWADDSTLLALRAVACGLTEVPLLVVGTLRPSPRPPGLDQLLDDLGRIGARTVRLGGLDSTDVDALACAGNGAPPGPVLRELLGRAAGNPLWIIELLHALADEGRLRDVGGVVEVDDGSLPGSLAELVVRRLRYLSDDTLGLLETAAVLGDSVSVYELAAVSRISSSEVRARLGEAFRALLLVERDDGAAFRHQLV
ncbi:MAG: AAA family ATPase, partial [Actinobacteria bacterium]|nr:AAA family ATPase [Actinomycetota bacterium]